MTDSEKDRLAVNSLPGYDPEIGRLLWKLEQTRQRTKERLEDLPAADLDWTPHPDATALARSSITLP